MNLIEFINENRGAIRGDALFEVSFGFIAPVLLTALSAVIMVFKISVRKCVVCLISNALAVCVYLPFFNVTFLDINSDNIGFGLVGNIIVPCLGVLLTIVNIVFNKQQRKLLRMKLLLNKIHVKYI